MASTPSTMLEIGTMAPDFNLQSVNGGSVSLNYAKQSKGFVIMFICNHCPYVLHIEDELVRVANEYISKGIGFIAISSNDVEKYPEDAPDKMAEKGYPFPYLYDESQEVAKAYKAACTPDLFVFDEQQKLVYRGQFDGSRPKNDVSVTGNDLRKALDALLNGEQIPENEQVPSLGCNIKWKPGNEPDYYG